MSTTAAASVSREICALFFVLYAVGFNTGNQYDYWIDDGATELVELWGDSDTFLKLHCRSFDSHIIVIDAFFTCSENSFHNIRWDVNKRCSGKNICSFILSKDCPKSTVWGNGTTYVQYACIPDKSVIKTCTANITVKLDDEGFIETPGYPRYYVGGYTCLWNLRADKPNMQIQIRLMDMALRGIGPDEKTCLDWLTVTEHGLNMLATCGDLFDDITLKSTGPELNISLKTASVNLFPKRGLLIHFQGVDGETGEAEKADCEGNAPRGAQLVMLNATHAHYRCIAGLMFAETASRDLIISCRYHHQPTEASCVFDPKYTVNMTATGDVSSEIGDEYSDIIGPSILLGLLLIGNAVIIGIIYFKRKRIPENGEWVAEPMKRLSQYE